MVEGDWPAVANLLQTCRLPIDGAQDHLQDFFVAVMAGEIVGVAGLERYETSGLLRSVAIAAKHRSAGIARQLVERIRTSARAHGLSDLYLLTTNAADYFSRLAFVPMRRQDAPSALLASVEFQGACPSSATLMRHDLDGCDAVSPLAQRLSAMNLRVARATDAAAIAAIYGPIVEHTTISFELAPPSADEMRQRIASTLQRLPWLVSEDENGAVNGYAYASKHRERAAYQWSIDTTVYVRDDTRGQGVGSRLYHALFEILKDLGYVQAYAGIALPNAASVGLHESVGFEPVGVYRNAGFKRGEWHDVGWWQRALQAPVANPQSPTAFVHGDFVLAKPSVSRP
jgi:phosphinothricin acetyltransferase